MNHAGNAAGWICSQCKRRVPRTIHSCRCGTRRPSTAGASPAKGSGLDNVIDAIRELDSGTFWKAAAIGFGGLFLLTILFLLRGPSTEAPELTGEPLAAEGAAEPTVQTAAVSKLDPLALNLNTTSAKDVERPLEDVIEEVLPAVVSLATDAGQGSGFFVDDNLIVTNYHVVGDSVSIDVKLHGGETIQGSVTRFSEQHDLALVRLNRRLHDHPTLELAPVEDVKVGQEVFAVGSPMGVLESSVTRGIVSAIRPMETVTLVQTDAAINSGNSGGPLIDRQGRVIGIATMKVADGDNLGFAVAADHATELMEGGGHRATQRSSTPQRPQTVEEHEQILEGVANKAVKPFLELANAVSGCSDVAYDFRGKSNEAVFYKLGEVVLEYVNQRRLYANGRRHIPGWSNMACLKRAEQTLIRCYEFIVIYDEVYKSYRGLYARRGREPRMRRHLPRI